MKFEKPQKSYFSHMKTASITEAKNNLSALIDSLESGSSVLILDRGRPVARLEPVSAGPESADERLSGLVHAGISRPRRTALPRPPEFLTEELPRVKEGESAVEALLRERREGR